MVSFPPFYLYIKEKKIQEHSQYRLEEAIKISKSSNGVGVDLRKKLELGIYKTEYFAYPGGGKITELSDSNLIASYLKKKMLRTIIIIVYHLSLKSAG